MPGGCNDCPMDGISHKTIKTKTKMKKVKLILATLFLGIILTNCVREPEKHKVTCYQTHDSSGDLIFWYLMMSPNGSTYYYSSPTQITDYSTVSWSEQSTGFNITEASQLSVESVESNGFSSDMQSTLDSQESNGFEGDNNNSVDNGADNSSTESGGFDGGSDGGGGDGGGGGE